MVIFRLTEVGNVPILSKLSVVYRFPKVYEVVGTKLVRVTIPVTSPAPIVVADPPMVRVFIAEPSHISRLPFVADGLALCRWSTPFTVISLLAVMPVVLFIVRLLKVVAAEPPIV